jgi:hypothetical protein
LVSVQIRLTRIIVSEGSLALVAPSPRTGHDAARGLVELVAGPAAHVRTAVGIEEKLEPLRYVQGASPGVALCLIQEIKSLNV